MSWLTRKPLLACALLAALLRGGLALVTEYKPIFPAYYYTDAELMDQCGWDMARAWQSAAPYRLPGSPTQRAQTFMLACVYFLFGHHPFVAKLFNALLGGLAVLIFGRFLEPLFGLPAALASALIATLWPSHIFFTSQNFKDALVILLTYLSLGGFIRFAASEEASLMELAAGCAALLLVGFLRAYILVVLAGTAGFCALAGLLSGLAQGRSSRRFALCLAGCALSASAYFPISKAVFAGPLASPGQDRDNVTESAPLIPAAVDRKTSEVYKPLSPQGLSEFRRLRQDSDRYWAKNWRGREIGTQLFYGLELHSWLDLALFLPKGLFYVLFMPLPLLYPIGHNLGRLMASLENVLLLLLAAGAAAGFWRGPKTTGRMMLLTFFLAMAAGSALLEFDLGSATRHRLLYMPMLFPFALALSSKRQPRKDRLKVLEVLECGGPGGTGNQVAALCNGLNPERFDVGLVYASRGSDPEKYKAQAAGAKKTFYVPELVREISPLNDLRAFTKLRRLFRAEEPDIVHAHSSKAGVLARLAAHLSGVPKIFYSPHGYGFIQKDRSVASRALYRLLEWKVSWIGEIVAVSPSEAEAAQALSWGKPVHTVCDAFLGEIPAPPSNHHAGTVVGSCGRITAARHPEAFVNVCQRITDSRNNVKCLWIGDGEQKPLITRHLENMNMLNKVEITGWLDASEARKRMAGLDVFIHYSRWDALPNAVLEAMALGLPVVASDIPGCRDCVVHGETGFLAKTEIELLEYCLKLIDDPELRLKMGAAGRERVLKQFDSRRAVSKTEELYLS